MKNLKRILALILCFLLLFGICACSPKEESSTTDNIIFKNNDEDVLGKPETELNPQEVYSNLEYSTKMFYGDYRILGGEDAEQNFFNQTPLIDFEVDNTTKSTSLPFRIQAGPHTLNNIITNVNTHEWMCLYFKSETNNQVTQLFSYVVEGNKLTLTALEEYNYDKETQKIQYSMTDKVLEYSFSFSGTKITLSLGSDKVELYTGLADNKDTQYFQCDNYYSDKNNLLDGLDHFKFFYNEKRIERTSFYVSEYNPESFTGNKIKNGVGVLSVNGLFTFTVPRKSGTKTHQYVYFYCGNDGIILTDGNNTYYYNADASDVRRSIIGGNISFEDTAKLGNMSERQLTILKKNKNDLFDELKSAYKESQVPVVINEESGEVSLNTAILFPKDRYDIHLDGRYALNKFVNIYSAIAFAKKYDGFISKVLVEGHTNTQGEYDINMTLSENQAKSVMDYSSLITKSPQLKAVMQSVGCGPDRPVYSPDGSVDMTASCRVAFRFIVKL